MGSNGGRGAPPGLGRLRLAVGLAAIVLASPGESRAKPYGQDCLIEVPSVWVEAAGGISRPGGRMLVARISHTTLEDSIDFYTDRGARRVSGTPNHDVLMVLDHPDDAPQGREYIRAIDGHPPCTVVVEFANLADDAIAKTVAESLRPGHNGPSHPETSHPETSHPPSHAGEEPDHAGGPGDEDQSPP